MFLVVFQSTQMNIPAENLGSVRTCASVYSKQHTIALFRVQQFVTDRKVDEEIGTINRFDADQDDIIPQIMGFGKGT